MLTRIFFRQWVDFHRSRSFDYLLNECIGCDINGPLEQRQHLEPGRQKKDKLEEESYLNVLRRLVRMTTNAVKETDWKL